jgi:thymidylate synthase (FAD)
LKVRVLAHTVLLNSARVLLEEYGYDAVGEDDVTQADALGEAAGRMCYQSWGRKNPATASNDGYMANILDHGHHSVLEHSSVTFLVRDVSRALLAELTRHRHLSFSVVSQRYVSYADTVPVVPPAFGGWEVGELRSAYGSAVESYERLVTALTGKGLARKQAREAARAVLPNAAPVDMVVSGNLRAWRDVLGKRHSTHADAEIQEFAGLVLAKLRILAPNSFQDIPEVAA